jgi:hypothetical protein
MFRLRFGPLAVAAGLGLVCGCLSLADRPLLGLNPFWRAHVNDCCDAGAVSDSAGPVVEELGPALPPGSAAVPLAPQNTVPQLAPAPRLVPEPQSRTAPYNPKTQ